MSDEIAANLVEAKNDLATVRAEYKEFAYIVSHDLSAVLRQVGGFAQIIYDKHADSFDARTTRHFDLIIEGAEAGKNILAGLLLYSRLNTIDAPMESVDCNAVFKAACQELAEDIAQIKPDISCDDLPVVTANKDRLKQVFIHLLENALTFTREDITPDINITVKESDDAWLFAVQDNGIGIRASHHQAIFDVLQTSAGKKYEGLGMGLAMSRKIIQQHGGNIWVDSEIGGGSKFYFTLPKTQI